MCIERINAPFTDIQEYQQPARGSFALVGERSGPDLPIARLTISKSGLQKYASEISRGDAN
jgi:hypothetical protein